ncbi:MAG: OmpA family protein, partial [Cyclobacteriaceae bacterium]|nr:OmpA family protein [Cyclobacteriaceae bacterium]
MNSSADDFGIYFFKADRGFFSSNRDGGKGDDDVYTFINQDPDLKIVNYYLAGRTMTTNDEDTLELLPQTKVKLLDYNGEVLDEVETAADGKFIFRVYEHEHYTLIGEKKSKNINYLTTRLSYTTVGRAVDRSTLTEMVTDITYDTLLVLEKQEINKVFVLENIYYDLDRAEIRPDAAVELDKLVMLLNDNPDIRIELSSHTDSRQTDQYNNRLSDRRARAAVEYLVDQGIAQSRLVAKGYGESKPFKIKDEKGNEIILTEEYIEGFADVDYRESLHQMNRRTEFKIIEIEIKSQSNNDEKYFDDDF